MLGLQEQERELLGLVQCPQLFMPAQVTTSRGYSRLNTFLNSNSGLYPSVQGDHANTFPGGLGQEVLGDKLEIQTFSDMKHGWTVRGGDNTTLVINNLTTMQILSAHIVL